MPYAMVMQDKVLLFNFILEGKALVLKEKNLGIGPALKNLFTLWYLG